MFDQTLDKIEQIRTISRSKYVEVAHVVLAWYVTRECIDVIIPGAKSADQVLNNLKTLEVQLTKGRNSTDRSIISS